MPPKQETAVDTKCPCFAKPTLDGGAITRMRREEKGGSRLYVTGSFMLSSFRTCNLGDFVERQNAQIKRRQDLTHKDLPSYVQAGSAHFQAMDMRNTVTSGRGNREITQQTAKNYEAPRPAELSWQAALSIDGSVTLFQQEDASLTVCYVFVFFSF